MLLKDKLPPLILIALLICTAGWVQAQTRQLPKVDAAQQKAQRLLQAKKQAIRARSQAFIQEKFDPRKPYKELKAMGKNDLKERFGILEGIYDQSKQEAKGFRLPSLLKFNGLQAEAMRQVAQRQGNYPLGIPQNFSRFQFNGGVSILGVPLKVQGLFTTEQSELRQPMNQFSVGLDLASVKRQLEQRVNARLQQLKKTYDLSPYQRLDKLYKFEQLKAIEDFSQGEVRQHLNELQQLKDLEELQHLKDWQNNGQTKLKTKGAAWAKQQKTHYYKQLGQKIKRNPALSRAYAQLHLSEADLSNPQALEQKLKKHTEAFKRQAQGVYASKKNALKQKYAGAKGKALQKLNAQLGKFLNTENLSVADLKNLYKNRDSLAKQAPERLLGYENMRILEAFKAGNNTEGLKQLQQAGIISLPEFLAASLQQLNIGTSHPEFTDFTLQNTRIDGLGIELQPGNLHLAYYGAQNKVAILGNNDYARRLRAYRLGWGKKAGNHLYINHLQGQDDVTTFRGDSIVTGIGDTSFFDKPRQNTVWGADLKWQWNGWELEAEFAQSQTVMDLSRESFATNAYNPRQFFSQPIADQGNLQVGQAYALKLHYQWGDHTTLHGKLARVTPGFFSLGVPYLRNDIEGGELSIEQKFWQGQLTVMPFYGRWHDNLTGRKDTTSQMDEYGVNLQWVPQKLPYVSIDYRKNAMHNSQLHQVDILSLQTGYHYTSGNTQMQTSITALLQETQTNLAGFDMQNISIRNYTAQQMASFRAPLQLSGQFSFIDQKGGRETGKWVTIGGSLTYTLWGVWQNTAKGNYGKNQQEGLKYDWGFESALTFLNFYSVSLAIDKTLLDTANPLNNYQELRGSVSLKARF